MWIMETKKILTTEQLDDARRLKALYESKKKALSVTQYTIADELGISQGAVGHYLNGRIALNPPMASGFARILQVSIADFSPSIAAIISGQASTVGENTVEYVGKVRPGLVPVVGDAVLGVDGMIDMVEYRGGWLKIYSEDPNAYGLRVKGDSMWPRIQSGEFVLIEPGTKIHPGDEVFARTTDGHNMIKVLNFTREGDYQFTSVNQDHRPITIEKHLIEKVEYVAGILKASRHVDGDDVDEVRS